MEIDVNKNYYSILEIDRDSTYDQIKSVYRKLSLKFHPDKNKSVDPSVFNLIHEAYKILSDNDLRSKYDVKSKYGKNYNEYFELFDINIDYDYKESKDRLEKFKQNEVLNIQIEVDDTFDGVVEYQRWSKCKPCDGSGKDLSSKIVIRDLDGNVLKMFEAEDGCDLCEGSGKDYRGNSCSFCSGKGKVGLNPCKNCNGEKRILGKQKLSGIKLTGDETKVEAMGHYSKDEAGRSGYLLLIKKSGDIE